MPLTPYSKHNSHHPPLLPLILSLPLFLSPLLSFPLFLSPSPLSPTYCQLSPPSLHSAQEDSRRGTGEGVVLGSPRRSFRLLGGCFTPQSVCKSVGFSKACLSMPQGRAFLHPLFPLTPRVPKSRFSGVPERVRRAPLPACPNDQPGVHISPIESANSQVYRPKNGLCTSQSPRGVRWDGGRGEGDSFTLFLLPQFSNHFVLLLFLP